MTIQTPAQVASQFVGKYVHSEERKRFEDGEDKWLFLMIRDLIDSDRRALLAESEEGLWNALKQQCCADPPNAMRCVMVSKADFLAALRRHLEATP